MLQIRNSHRIILTNDHIIFKLFLLRKSTRERVIKKKKKN